MEINNKKIIEGVQNYFYYKFKNKDGKKLNSIDEEDLLEKLQKEEFFNDIKNIQPKLRKRYDDYKEESHPLDKDGIISVIQKGIDENEKRKLNGTESNFQAEKFYSRYFLVNSIKNTILGDFIDYEVPLKSSELDEGLGEIDLLSCNKITGDAYIIEVKRPDNNERPLRAILESYTYWKIVGGDEPNHFLNNSRAKGSKTLKKCVMVYYNKNSSIYNSFKIKWDKYYYDLMKKLDIKMFIAITSKEEKEVSDFFTQKIVEVGKSFLEAEKELLR